MIGVSIDKLRSIVPTDKESHSASLQFMHSLIGEKDKKKYKFWKTAHNTNASMPIDGGQSLHMCAGISNKQTYVAFEFNPAKFGSDSWSSLECTLECMLISGYNTLYETGRTRRIDFALDFPGVCIADVRILNLRLNSYNHDLEKLGSFYLGSKQSNKHFIAYDKAKEIQAKGGACPHKELYRIEARLCHPLRLWEIEKLNNPFFDLIVIDRSRLLKESPANIFQALGYSIKSGFGIQKQFLSLPNTQRVEIAHLLAAYQPSWWNPVDCWEHCLAQTINLHPALVEQHLA